MIAARECCKGVVSSEGGLFNFIANYKGSTEPNEFFDWLRDNYVADSDSKVKCGYSCYIHGYKVTVTEHGLDIDGSEEEQEKVREFLRNFVKEKE